MGQLIIQLCHLLQLRCVAIVREREQTAGDFTQCADRLKALGATHVLADKGSLKVCSHLQSSLCSCLLAPVNTALQLSPLSMLLGRGSHVGRLMAEKSHFPPLSQCLVSLMQPLPNSSSILARTVMILHIFEDAPGHPGTSVP